MPELPEFAEKAQGREPSPMRSRIHLVHLERSPRTSATELLFEESVSSEATTERKPVPYPPCGQPITRE
ncbi:hypothetical protein cyc_01199 [Cyclospora cayetanensis]|uniref:Uncharacterized protein n=1 Tax=Cyclospora cayetanensis TaxID=88456 RepID=A0A1D3CXZ2_9EIME|nr:hypothetical protein cyc_01199 [Cyclospora cayetanensis]